MKRILQMLFVFYQHTMQKIFARKKRVLVCCASQTMASHVIDYCKCVKDMPNLKVRMWFAKDCNAACIEQVMKTTAPWGVKRIRGLHARLAPMHLVVSADRSVLFPVNKDCAPILYVNHGPHIVGRENGAESYAYSKPEDCCFAAMLEPNRVIAQLIVEEKPFYKDKVEWVGYKFAYEIEEAMTHREEYRKNLGIAPDEVFVMMFGTWGPESLFHALGEGLFPAVEKLRDRYRFGFSIHPREYTNYNPSIKPLGQKVEEQTRRGVLVRNPKEDWMPWMIAADIVVADYSSMYENAILAKKKLIFSPFSPQTVWKHSTAAKIAGIVPVLRQPEELAQVLARVDADPVQEEIFRYADALYTPDYPERVKAVTQKLLEGKQS